MTTQNPPTQQESGGFVQTLLAIGTWIVQNKDLVGRTYAEVTNGVTNIKRWQNDTDQEVKVWKYDHGSMQIENAGTIPPKSSRDFDMWIPWADSADQYSKGARGVLEVGGKRLAYFWQSGPLVRFNTDDAFVPNGRGAPGLPSAGGDRQMVIARDPQGIVGFALAKR